MEKREELPPAEDIKKVERRVAKEEKQLGAGQNSQRNQPTIITFKLHTMKNLRFGLTGREVSKAENQKGLSQREVRQAIEETSIKPRVKSRIDSITAGKRLDYGSETARIWKYAAMLLMVLTVGVGEMWGV